jgi:hypothetical protein
MRIFRLLLQAVGYFVLAYVIVYLVVWVAILLGVDHISGIIEEYIVYPLIQPFYTNYASTLGLLFLSSVLVEIIAFLLVSHYIQRFTSRILRVTLNIVLAFFLISLSSHILEQVTLFLYYLSDVENIESYVTSGCGKCDGVEPARDECLYRSQGDDIGEIIQIDRLIGQSIGCKTQSCLPGISYRYCD